MKIRLFIITSIIAILLANSIYGQNFVDVTKSNNEQTIILSSNQILEVKLPRISSAGYTWCESITSADKTIQQSIARIEDGDFILDAVSGTFIKGRRVGQSGTQVLRYVGASQGTTVLTLELRRPWEKNNPAIDNFTITVVSGGKYTGNYTPPLKEISNKHVTGTPPSVPSQWDWRPQCTPIKDQYQCGDCWAFAGVGTFECNILIIDGITRDISEEYLTNCYTGNGCEGCNGGNCPHAAWLASYSYGGSVYEGGAVYESEDPWTTSEGNGKTGTCGGPYAYHETIDSYADVPGENADSIPPDANMKDAIYYYGPIWVAVDASSKAWTNYSGGIFTETSPTGQTDHAVVLVGWCDSAAVSGGGYWILRNSWGTGWGVNGSGYMYISYGSDLIGQSANYIVYKSGIPHAVPPVVIFGASVTSSCSGVIQFKDSSYNAPTSWLWNFGDNTTSTLQNPSHTYTTSGTFNVKLVAINNYGSDSLTKISYITINLSAPPTTTGASCTGPCSVTLSASGNGTLNWYAASSGGTLLHTGTSYTTPVLTDTTTYYVQSEVQQPVQSVGLAAKKSTGGYYYGQNYTGDWGLVFDVLTPVTIVSVTVYVNSTASRTIWLENSSGTVIDSLVTSISSGKQSVSLNFTVPAGTGYVLGTNGQNNLWRDNAGAAYPYTTGGLVSIIGNNAPGAANHYYYFYNWQVQPPPCLSPMIPVVTAINSVTGINETSVSDFGIFPNPNTGKFDIKLNNLNYQNVTITMFNVLGETLLQKKVTSTNFPLQIDASSFQDGLYYVKVQTDKATFSTKIIIYKK